MKERFAGQGVLLAIGWFRGERFVKTIAHHGNPGVALMCCEEDWIESEGIDTHLSADAQAVVLAWSMLCEMDRGASAVRIYEITKDIGQNVGSFTERFIGCLWT